MNRSIDVLDDVALGIEIGKDVDGRVSDEERFGIGRHIHDEDMADPPCCAQAGLARGYLTHELVRVQAALHQELAFGFVDKFNCLCRCRFAVGHVDNLKTIDVQGQARAQRRKSSRPARPESER